VSTTLNKTPEDYREPSQGATDDTERASDVLATHHEARQRKIEADAAGRRVTFLKDLAARYAIHDGATDTERRILRETRSVSGRLAELSRHLATFPNRGYAAEMSPSGRLDRRRFSINDRLAGPQHTWAAYADDPTPKWTPFPSTPTNEIFYAHTEQGSALTHPFTRKIESADPDGTISMAALTGYWPQSWPQETLVYPYDSIFDPWQITEASAGYEISSGDLNALVKQPTKALAFCSIDMPVSPYSPNPAWGGKLIFGSAPDDYARFGGFLYVSGNCALYLSVGSHDLGLVGLNHFLSVGEQGSTVFPQSSPYTDQEYVPQVEMLSSVTIDPAWLNPLYPSYAVLSVVVEMLCVRINYIPDGKMNIVGFDFRPSDALDKDPGVFPFGPGTTWSGVVDSPAPIKVNSLGLTVRA